MPDQFARRFQIIAEIDATYWLLEQMLEQEKRRSVIDRMIDEATGFDSEKLRVAKQWMARVKRLKAKLGKMDKSDA